jgi:hypothetical protein
MSQNNNSFGLRSSGLHPHVLPYAPRPLFPSQFIPSQPAETITINGQEITFTTKLSDIDKGLIEYFARKGYEISSSTEFYGGFFIKKNNHWAVRIIDGNLIVHQTDGSRRMVIPLAGPNSLEKVYAFIRRHDCLTAQLRGGTNQKKPQI